MHVRARGRGFSGSRPPKNDSHLGSLNIRPVLQITAPKPCRIVSVSSMPQRPPVALRLGWPVENMIPQLNGPRLSKGPLLPNPPLGPSSTNLNPRKSCKIAVDSTVSSQSGVPSLMSIPMNGKYQSSTSLNGWNMAPACQKIKVPINPLEKAARELSCERDKDDFTNDVLIDGFTPTKPVQQNLDTYVLNLLHSIEENGPPNNKNRDEDLEEGECEEPQDFPSRMVQYHQQLEAAYTFVPVNATNATTNANQTHVKPPSPVETETRNLKQALEEIRRRESHSSQKSSPATSQTVEEKIIRITGPITAISGEESERRSGSQPSNPSNGKQGQVIVSYDPKDMRLTVTRHGSRSPMPRKDDTEWRREVRIVERCERNQERQPSRDREARRTQRSASRNRSHSPWRRQVRRSSPTRRRSRSRSLGRRRSRSRSPAYRRARSRSRSPHLRRHRSRSGARRMSKSPNRRGVRSPVRREIRSPIRREVRSPIRREIRSPIRREIRSPIRRVSRSPVRKESRDRSRTPYTERKVVVRRSRSPCRPPSRRSPSRTPTPKIREELMAVRNGTASVQKPVVSQHFVPTTSTVPTAATEGSAIAHPAGQPAQLPVNYTTHLPFQPVPAHPVVPSPMMAHPGYYGQPLVSVPQEHYMLHQFSSHQPVQSHAMGLNHPQFLMQHQLKQQLEEQLQQQCRNYNHTTQQQQQQLEQGVACSPVPPVGPSAENNQNLTHKSPTCSDTPDSSTLAAHKDDVALLEQRLRAQRDSKLEKQLNLIHQLLIVRFQQADSEQKQKVATTEVERERLTLSILEKAKLEKEMATSAQSLDKFIQRATNQLKEDLEEVKKEKMNYLYRFYDPQQHWCELCDTVCEKLPDYLNHLHSKEHEQRLESTGVPSMPWHSKQKSANHEGPSGKDGLIANRIPFGGLQSLQPVKAWYCEMCDVWMGDIHCAQLHMTSTQHNNSFLKRTMERPDPVFLHAVKKQAALKRSNTRKKEEERTRNELSKKRKSEEVLEARKKKKMEIVEKKKRTAGTQNHTIKFGPEELNQQPSTVNGCRDINDQVTHSGSSSPSSNQAEDGDGSGPGSCSASRESSEEAERGPVNLNDILIENRIEETNLQVKEVSDEAVVQITSSATAINGGCEERPLDGSEVSVGNSVVSPVESGDLEDAPKNEAASANEPRGDVVNEKLNEPKSKSNDCPIEGQKHGSTRCEEHTPGPDVELQLKTNSQHSSTTNCEVGEAYGKDIKMLPLTLKRNTSETLSNADQNAPSINGGKAVESVVCPVDADSQGSRARGTLESSHLTSMQMPPPLVPIFVKTEPEELRPVVKIEPSDFVESTTRPVTLVKTETLTSANQAESCTVAPIVVPERITIKKESEIKKEVKSPEDNKDAEQQTGNDDGSDDDDCCIIEEVDGRSARNFDMVDLEPSASLRRGSVSSTHVFDAPDDAVEPEVSVQLSDYIVLSETGDDGLQDSAEVD